MPSDVVMTEYLDRNHERYPLTGEPDICFVAGYPQNQQQRNQSRATIQSYSARIRWRRGATTAKSSRAGSGRPRTGDRQLLNTALCQASQADQNRYEDVLPSREVAEHAPSDDAGAMVVFQHTLNDLTLPPLLVLEHGDLMTKTEVWVEVQKSKSTYKRLSTCPRNLADFRTSGPILANSISEGN